MTAVELRNRLHARLAARESQDSGFVLIYVLMIITIVTVLVGSVLVISANSVVPSVQSSYGQAAQAAAQAGIQDVQATANALCLTSTATSCLATLTGAQSHNGTAVRIDNGSTPSYSATFTWSVAPTLTAAGLLRVTSTGAVARGGLSAKRVLVADLTGGTTSSCFDYAACTQYETQSPDAMAQSYPSRTIPLSPTALGYADAAPGASGSSVTWNGPTITSSGTSAGTVNSCNDVYYNATTGTGRETHSPVGTSSPFVDWTESGSIGSQGVTEYQPCQVSLGSSTKLVATGTTWPGGYATNDALLLSNSNPGATGGPLLNEPVYTTYRGSTDPANTTGHNYRSFTLPGYYPPVGGQPSSASTTQDATVVSSVPGPITAAPTVPANSCLYRGPTRVLFNANGTATVTSPQTTAAISGSPGWCYPATPTGGIYQYTTPALSTVSPFSGVFSVADAGSRPTTLSRCSDASGHYLHTATGWDVTCQRAGTTPTATNTIFYRDSGPLPTVTDPSGSFAQESGCPSTGYSTSAYASCAWTGVKSTTDGNGGGAQGWTSYTSGTNCSASLASTDRLAFECDFNGGSVGTPHDYYSIFRNRVEIDLSRNTCQSGTTAAQQSCIQAFLTSELNPANNAAHQYIVTASPPVVTPTATKTLASNAAPLGTSDPFFDSSSNPGSPTTETLNDTTFTFTISRQVYKCYGVVVLGLCLLSVGGPVLGYSWGSDTTSGASTPQFTVTITNQTASMTSAGSVGKSFFPYMQDVTQYGTGVGGANGSTGPGDLYVEGTPTVPVALLASDDVVLTGSLTPGNSSTGIEVAAQNDVRVYHPVSCLATASQTSINATTPGFCPNDLTGLYNAIPTNGYRPYQQYTNLRPDLTGMTVNAAVFALGVANTGTIANAPCPKWSTSGICGGEFTVDNYNRGSALGALALTGTVFQEHHGALGEEWEVPDSAGQTRPYTGYTETLTYQNLKTLIGTTLTGLIPTSNAVSSGWHAVSVSTGTS